MTSFSTVATVQSDVSGIKAKTDNLPAVPAAQGDVTAVSAKVDTAQTGITAIKSKTDNLPAAPAATGDITAAAATTDGKIDAAKAVVDAIKAKTDNLPAVPAAQGDVTAVSAKIPAAPTTQTTGTWTPAAGKKFRLNAYEVTANVTVAGTLLIKDGATTIKTFQAGVGNFSIARNLLANGYLSLAANNALTCVVGTATATISANWEGSEE